MEEPSQNHKDTVAFISFVSPVLLRVSWTSIDVDYPQPGFSVSSNESNLSWFPLLMAWALVCSLYNSTWWKGFYCGGGGGTRV
jgi:hypothetical protein